jgi:hypothetical protein
MLTLLSTTMPSRDQLGPQEIYSQLLYLVLDKNARQEGIKDESGAMVVSPSPKLPKQPCPLP